MLVNIVWIVFFFLNFVFYRPRTYAQRATHKKKKNTRNIFVFFFFCHSSSRTPLLRAAPHTRRISETAVPKIVSSMPEWINFGIRENRHIDLDFVFHSCSVLCVLLFSGVYLTYFRCFRPGRRLQCRCRCFFFVCECVKSMLYGASKCKCSCVWRTKRTNEARERKSKICTNTENWI